MMLATALGKMIDKTECLLFINSPNSISTSDIEKPETHSPWLLLELGLVSTIRRKTPERLIHEMFTERRASASLPIKHDLTEQMKTLQSITPTTLGTWYSRHNMASTEGAHALDTLYEITKN
jgi:hypothetical protein